MSELPAEFRAMPVEELLTKWREEATEHRRVEVEARKSAERKERAVEALEEALGIEQPMDREDEKNERIGKALRRANPDVRGIAAIRTVIAEEPTRTWRPIEIHEILV